LRTASRNRAFHATFLQMGVKAAEIKESDVAAQEFDPARRVAVAQN